MTADVVGVADPYWRTVWNLKSVFDPDNLIAPGRYSLAQALEP